MFAQHFGLTQDPFSLAPDPRYLFVSERHREALAHLLYGVQGAGGFVLLSGEIGTGKTTVCRCFLEQVPPHCDVAYIFNPKLSVGELLQTVCEELRIPAPPAEAGVKAYTDVLNAHLLRAHAAGRNTVLIIDEAQNLSTEVLEQLRLLTNLETNERKLLQIVLIGQPQLRELLRRPELEQLAQRVIARYHLGSLSAHETAQYVAHRLAVVGHQGANPFSATALKRIHTLSAGVPRRINLLCHHAMLGAYALGTTDITPNIVSQAAREVFDPVPWWRAFLSPAATLKAQRPWVFAAWLFILGLVLALIIVLVVALIATLQPGHALNNSNPAAEANSLSLKSSPLISTPLPNASAATVPTTRRREKPARERLPTAPTAPAAPAAPASGSPTP